MKSFFTVSNYKSTRMMSLLTLKIILIVVFNLLEE